jgi:predicted unusual protein kinase regulating ubiquinone biosynthesis (AarF/ABC1/UbiB family)
MASLGQVHHARLKDGREVAIKVRYPQVDQEIEEQLDLVFLAFRNVPKLVSKTLDVADYETFLRDFFLEEINYVHEAQMQDKFRRRWNGVVGITVPEVYLDLSSQSILTQSFEDAANLNDLWNEPKDVREKCAEKLALVFLDGLFSSGLFHADLHPKNWGFRTSSQTLVLYDFGGTLVIPENMRHAIRRLAQGSFKDSEDCLSAYEAIGFARLPLMAIKDRLIQLNDILFEPLKISGEFDVTQWRLQERVDEILGESKWNFRTAGPPWFLMVIRSLGGLTHAIQTLRVKVDFRSLIDFSPSTEFAPVWQPSGVSSLTTHLNIQILEGNEERVALEFPSRTVEDLEALIPEDVLLKLIDSGIDLKQIKANAVSSGYAPQVLFETQKGARRYRVWLK